MFYNALIKFRDEQLENYQGQPLEYSASDYHHISRPGGKVRRDRSSSKRRSHVSIVKDLHRRMGSNQDPKSCASIESYDPYRSPKNRGVASEAKYAQITIHRGTAPEVPEKGEVSPAVKPPPSIAEEEEPEVDDVTSSPFTVLQKRKHKPSSMKSIHSSKLPHSSSRCPGMSTRSMSYRRNVSFHHVRNRSQGSNKPKRRKTAQNQQTELKRSPSAASLQMLADGIEVPIVMPSSPPLPAQPTVVRPSGVKVKSMCQTGKIRDSDIIWKEDARKVSHELSQICEEAFNGSSVTTIRTASTATGYETPATPVSVTSQDHHANMVPKASADTPKPAPKDPSRSYSIQELTETRRKLVEHSKGRTDNIPAYLSGVISHLDRLIEDHQSQNCAQRDMVESHSTLVDPFGATTETLPVINEEFASPVRGPGDTETKPKSKPSASAAASRFSDAKATIRMVPHSSLRSLDEVKPLMIRKKNQLDGSDANTSDAVDPARTFSASSRQSRHPCGLDPIEEVPGSPKRNDRGPDSKKWSWFKHRPQFSDTPPALPPKDKPITPSNGTVVVHAPFEAPRAAPKPVETRAPTRKSSMERFGGVLLKKLMPKKANKSDSQPKPSKLHFCAPWSIKLRPIEAKGQEPKAKDHRNSALLCKGFPDPESSFESDDQRNPPKNKRLSLANQNWFARVFQIKPASRVIALNTSKVKGRKEVYKLLREWEDYGMEDVYMDKSNSVVHGRVGEVNCESTQFVYQTFSNFIVLRLREVEFTAEFYTVLEHGRQANLSLVRFKQERGAASSFNKVVDTVHLMLKSRGMIVEDPVRAKKMSRVLDAIPNAA